MCSPRHYVDMDMTLNFRIFLVALVLIVVSVAAFAVELTDDEQDECRARGGCILIPMDLLKEKFEAIFEKGHEAGRISCGNRT